ncbi:MAG: Gfo/Idh/MocA family protein, partial [Thermoanaerobaculia bacterium]
MKKTPVRIGIVGCGNVLDAYWAAAEKLRHRGLAEVTLACGREAQRARVQGQLGVRSFTTRDEELVRSEEVDLVVVLTSPNTHGPIARAALEAGKHVLVEKPLSVSLEEARDLVELSRRSRGRLACAPFTTLSPTYRTIGSRVRKGDIGRVLSARARYGWSGPWWSDWFYRPGGGSIFDLGVYCLTSLTGLLGPAKRVMAMTGAAIPERQVQGRRVRVEADDNAQVLLDFGGSVFAAVTTGFTIQQYRSAAFELYGSEGTVQMTGDDWAPEGYELWQNSLGAWQLYREADTDWHWTDGLRHLVECIHGGTAPASGPEHALHVLEVMLKAQASG